VKARDHFHIFIVTKNRIKTALITATESSSSDNLIFQATETGNAGNDVYFENVGLVSQE